MEDPAGAELVGLLVWWHNWWDGGHLLVGTCRLDKGVSAVGQGQVYWKLL